MKISEEWALIGTAGILVSSLLLFWLREVRAETIPEKTGKNPGQTSPKGSSAVEISEPKSSSSLFFTPPEFVKLGAIGSWKGRPITLEPFLDSRNDLYARVIYSSVESALDRFGMRLLTESEWKEIHDSPQALILEPCTLDWRGPMQSIDYARKHDACLKEQVSAAGGLQDRILVNAGKQWLSGAPKGKSINFGWFRTKDGTNAQGQFRAKGTPIQTPGTAHEASYTDYSQLLMAIQKG